MPTPEGIIKKAICEYLSYQRGCLFWVNASTGIYDPTKKLFRKPRSQYQRNGVADILGIYQNKPLAIEVKSAKGRLSEAQECFLADFKRAGGIAIVARSIDDVIEAFKLFKGE